MTFLRHLAGYLPVKIASAIGSFGGIYAFTRLLGAEAYGRYALLFSLFALLHTLTLTWAEAANYRFAARAQRRARLANHYRTGVTLMGRALLAAMIVWACLFAGLSQLEGYRLPMLWLGALLPLATIIQFALEAHRAAQRVGRYATVATIRTLAGFALGALLAATTGLGAAAPFAGLVGASLVLAIGEGAFLLRASRGGHHEPRMARAWAAYGLPVAAALVLDLVLSASDRFLIAIFLGEAAVGAYAAGYGVADKTVLLICAWAAMAGSPLVLAAYERAGSAGAAAPARNLARTLLLLGLPAATGLALVARPLAEVMIGPDLRSQAVEIIPWIAFAGLLNGLLIHYCCEAFQLARRTGLRAALMAVPAGLNIALNLVALPWLGLMGAVYATLASYGAGVVLLALVGRRYVALPWPRGDAARIALAALAMWPVIALLPETGRAWSDLLVQAVAGALTYGLVILALDAAGVRGFLLERRKRSGRPGNA